MHDIFISYAEEDRDRARLFADAFVRRGWSGFWDRKIPIGSNWPDWIGRELEQAASAGSIMMVMQCGEAGFFSLRNLAQKGKYPKARLLLRCLLALT
jgi:TIR domain